MLPKHTRIARVRAMHLNQSVDDDVSLSIFPNSLVNISGPILNDLLHPLFCDFFFVFDSLFLFFYPQELGSSTHLGDIAWRRASELCQIKTSGKALLELAFRRQKRRLGLFYCI